VVATVSGRTVPVPPPVIARQELTERREQVVVAAGAGLDDGEAGRRMWHPHVQQTVAACRDLADEAFAGAR
jgi:hypothetical protein